MAPCKCNVTVERVFQKCLKSTKPSGIYLIPGASWSR